MENGCFYARGLKAGYGKRPVAEGLSFHAGRGEIVTIIGPNGAGKSTVLKTIAGSLPALGGELVLDGVPMERIPGRERAKKLAVVFTEKLQGELMTCRDVAAAGRYPYTGRLGLYQKRTRGLWTRPWSWSMEQSWGTGPLTGSAMDSASGSCWHGPSARSRR